MTPKRCAALAAVLLTAPPLLAQDDEPAGAPAPTAATAQRRVRAATGLGFAVLQSKIRRRLIRTDTPWGFLVDEVVEDSPAAAAGIEPGWILLEWAEHPIRQVGEVDRWLWALPAGAEVEVSFARKKKDAPFWSRDPWEDGEVTLVIEREHPLRARWGVGLFPPEDAAGEPEATVPENRPAGVGVHEVVAGSAAERAGLRRGDVITAWRDAEVASLEELRQAESEGGRGETVEVRIERHDGGAWRPLRLELARASEPDDDR